MFTGGKASPPISTGESHMVKCGAGEILIGGVCTKVQEPGKIIPWTKNPKLWIGLFDPNTKTRYKVTVKVHGSEKGLAGLEIAEVQVQKVAAKEL